MHLCWTHSVTNWTAGSRYKYVRLCDNDELQALAASILLHRYYEAAEHSRIFDLSSDCWRFLYLYVISQYLEGYLSVSNFERKVVPKVFNSLPLGQVLPSGWLFDQVWLPIELNRNWRWYSWWSKQMVLLAMKWTSTTSNRLSKNHDGN